MPWRGPHTQRIGTGPLMDAPVHANRKMMPVIHDEPRIPEIVQANLEAEVCTAEGGGRGPADLEASGASHGDR